jgi:hypothetical protein
LDTLQTFEWQVAVGDEILTLQEFEELLKEKRAIVRFKDGFVRMEA